MMHFLIILNLLLLPLFYWRLLAIPVIFVGMLLWKLRYVVAVFVAGLLVWIGYLEWGILHPIAPSAPIQTAAMQWHPKNAITGQPEDFPQVVATPTPNYRSTVPPISVTGQPWALIPVTGQPSLNQEN